MPAYNRVVMPSNLAQPHPAPPNLAEESGLVKYTKTFVLLSIHRRWSFVLVLLANCVATWLHMVTLTNFGAVLNSLMFTDTPSEMLAPMLTYLYTCLAAVALQCLAELATGHMAADMEAFGHRVALQSLIYNDALFFLHPLASGRRLLPQIVDLTGYISTACNKLFVPTFVGCTALTYIIRQLLRFSFVPISYFGRAMAAHALQIVIILLLSTRYKNMMERLTARKAWSVELIAVLLNSNTFLKVTGMTTLALEKHREKNVSWMKSMIERQLLDSILNTTHRLLCVFSDIWVLWAACYDIPAGEFTVSELIVFRMYCNFVTRFVVVMLQVLRGFIGGSGASISMQHMLTRNNKTEQQPATRVPAQWHALFRAVPGFEPDGTACQPYQPPPFSEAELRQQATAPRFPPEFDFTRDAKAKALDGDLATRQARRAEYCAAAEEALRSGRAVVGMTRVCFAYPYFSKSLSQPGAVYRLSHPSADGNAQHKSKLLLRDATWALPNGACALVRGANGAGKSTIGHLLCRLYDPLVGQVWAATLSSRMTSPPVIEPWRRNIGYMSQDMLLLPGTVAENIVRVSCTHPDQMARALKRIHSLVTRLKFPLGSLSLDRQVVGNSSLSGGQRQKISLLALLLQHPVRPIWILDEPTNAIDIHTHKWLVQYLSETISSMRQIHGVGEAGGSKDAKATCPRSILIITHDADLVNVATQCLFVTRQTVWTGDVRAVKLDTCESEEMSNSSIEPKFDS